uniref:uncharacterized protein LOC122610185 n=1 Tax=Erigeron canadensis TaxID=72917 RepID=UPI001CB9A10E|nr:uncharacterized protein LOC122610185 [Erigeron canadensis]
MELEGFNEVISSSWNKKCNNPGNNAFSIMKDKRKILKCDIKNWRKDRLHDRNPVEITKDIAEVDIQISIFGGNDDLYQKRRSLLLELQSFDQRRNSDLKQKDKINWSVEGDGNSKFFHACINKRRRSGSINGIKHNGQWITVPPEIKNYDISNMVSDFYHCAFIPPGCNSSFITLIPKVQNPVLISDYHPISLIGLQYKIIAKLLATRLANVIDSVVSSEQTAFIKDKIDFAKAYDSLSWEFLFSILTAMGFGLKWRSWIQACLSSAKSSVLVNGSPSEEFPIRRGLRQGDPMAPFLYIIAMEDDVMVVGEWSNKSMITISNALSHGVGVTNSEVENLARKTGCKAESLPFKYLGIPIGCSSTRIATWEPIISKFKKKLSTWKANLLSVGGRSTLITSGGNSSKCKIAWVKWGAILASKEDGGLGFGSLEAMNQALLYRWRWRALLNNGSLWARVLAAIHGENCFGNLTAKHKGVWSGIVDSARSLHDILSFASGIISRKVGNGSCTKFWNDIWCGDSPLAARFPRLYALQLDKNCSISDCWDYMGCKWNWRRDIRSGCEQDQLNQLLGLLPSVLDIDGMDTWTWNLNGKTEFSIAQIRQCLDHYRLPISNTKKTKWNTWVPRKVNVFMWRMRRDCIPTNINLFTKGIDVSTFRCFHCQNGVETINHIFNRCKFADEVRHMLNSWMKVDIPKLPPEATLLWWKGRNNTRYNNNISNSVDTFNSIVAVSFLWNFSKLIDYKLDVIFEMKLLLLDTLKEIKSSYGDGGCLQSVYRKINDVFSLKEIFVKEGEDVDIYLNNIWSREGVGKDNELVFKEENHGATFDINKFNNMSQEYEIEVNLDSNEADVEIEREYEIEKQNNETEVDDENNVENQFIQDSGGNYLNQRAILKQND